MCTRFPLTHPTGIRHRAPCIYHRAHARACSRTRPWPYSVRAIMSDEKLQGSIRAQTRFKVDMPQFIELYIQGRLRSEIEALGIGRDEIPPDVSRLNSCASTCPYRGFRIRHMLASGLHA